MNSALRKYCSNALRKDLIALIGTQDCCLLLLESRARHRRENDYSKASYFLKWTPQDVWERCQCHREGDHQRNREKIQYFFERRRLGEHNQQGQEHSWE